MISFSWMNLRAGGEFELQLVLAGERVAPEMKITSGITRAEAYSASGLEYPLVLRAIRDLSEDPGLSVAPNPFSEEVRLSFDIADGHDYRLMVTDVAGRVLWSREDMGGPGPEWHRVLSGDLAGQGIYYAVLQTRETRIVKKMVFIPSR
jgi:hypothetical protein